jgi:hypothetical protein
MDDFSAINMVATSIYSLISYMNNFANECKQYWTNVADYN